MTPLLMSFLAAATPTRAAFDSPLVAAAPAAATPSAPARRPSVAPAAYFVKSAASLADVERTLHGKGAHGADLLKPGATSMESSFATRTTTSRRSWSCTTARTTSSS